MMDYPATQMFVNDDEAEEEEETDGDAGTPLRIEKNIKVGILLVDSATYPVHKGINRVGRINTCHIVINHNTISKEHAEIEAGMGSKSTFISDLGSLNKTRLNDAILRPKRLYQLQYGDVVRFGSVQAMFKAEEDKVPETSVSSRDLNDFVIPETPAPNTKELLPIIPDSPDLSIDRSLTDDNRSSDVSLISATQEGENVRGRSLLYLDLGKNRTSEISNPADIFDLETQKNISATDSDEENIFDMKTQQSNIHEVNTQTFSANNVQTVPQTEQRTSLIEDLETQTFPNYPDDEIESRSELINDIETQKLPVHNIIINSRLSLDNIQSLSCLVNDEETKKPEALNKHYEDSETDEEGIFEDNGEGNMFDAPTQLIRLPHAASKSPCEVLRSDNNIQTENMDTVPKKNGIIPQENGNQNIDVAGPSVTLEGRIQDSIDVKNRTDINAQEEKRATLNDSIESKLNHMFDDVNETDDADDEPTQMLTQHLETILESTQMVEPDLHQRPANIPNPEDVDTQIPTFANCEANEDNTEKSDEPEENEPTAYDPEEEIGLPEILSTQELFRDLPAVNIFGTPPARSSRERIKLSPLSDVGSTPRSGKSKKSESSSSNAQNQSGGSRRAEFVVSDKSADSKNGETKKAESAAIKIEQNRTPSTAGDRRKRRIRTNPVLLEDLEKAGANREECINVENRKRLPLKKRGSSVLSDPPTPRKATLEVVASTPRLGTRSNMKIPIESGKRTKRLTNGDSRKISKPKAAASGLTITVNYNKPESPTPILAVKTKLSSHRKKGTRSRRVGDASSTVEATLRKETEPKPVAPPQRAQKQPSDASASVSGEETTPIKRPRTNSSALPSTVSDNPRAPARRGKRKNANSREVIIPKTNDTGVDQNQSLSTRTRSTRNAVRVSLTDDCNGSTLSIANSHTTGCQSSLESQEIQAILGVVDQGDNKTRKIGGSPIYHEKAKAFRIHLKNDDFSEDVADRVSSVPGISKQEFKDGFRKPVGKVEKTKRQTRRLPIDTKETNDDDDITEASKKRRKTRSKKNSDSVDRKNPPTGVTHIPTVAVGAPVGSSNVRPQSKPVKNEKTLPEKIKPEDPRPSVIVVQAATPVRNKRGVSQRVVEDAGKENVVEKTAPKRGRKRAVEVKPEKQNSTLTSAKVSQSSSPLRRGRSAQSTPTSATISSAKTMHKILFTGLNDPRLISIVHNLGGTVTEKPNDCTALVTDKVRRTYKFLCGMAMAVPIVSVDWLTESEMKGRFLETGDFLLKDPVEEAKFKFNLRRSLVMATDDKLLEGYTVVLTPNTAPPPNAEMKGLIQAWGAKALSRPPARWPEKSLIISRREDMKNAKKMLSKAPKSVRLLSVEFILTGILRHELNFEEHKLEVD